jgi:PAS domain S-box-containing protein
VPGEQGVPSDPDRVSTFITPGVSVFSKEQESLLGLGFDEIDRSQGIGMTAGPFCWQIDQMREYLNTLRTSFLHQHPNGPERTVRSITGLEELLDRLEAESSRIADLAGLQNEPGDCTISPIEEELITDDRGVIIKAGDGMEALLNVPIAALKGKPWGIYLHPQSKDLYSAITERLGHGEVIHAAELYLQPRNRGVCPITVKAKTLISADGTIEGMHWLVRVIPERHQAHRSLQATEERFLIAAESILDRVYEHETATDQVHWFGRARDLHLYPVTGNGWEEGIHPDDREQVKRGMTMHLRTGAPFAEEYRLRLRDGQVIVVADRATAIRDRAGRPIRWVGAITDITVQRRAAEALKQSEERFRTLAESIRDGLTIVEDRTVVYLNEQAAAILGYPREELLEMNPLQMAEPEEVPLLTALLDEAGRNQILPEVLEFWIHQKDGSRRCVQNRFTSIKDGRYSVITTDVTGRRTADEENARHAKDLEEKNEELRAAATRLRRLTADLDDQKERLRSVLTATPEEILIIDRDLRISYLNPSAASALQLNAGENLDATVQVLGISGECISSILEKVTRVFSEGDVIRGQYRREEGGAVQHLAYILSPIQDRTGEIEAILMASRDITDRVTAAEALAESERRYRSLVDLAPDAIVIHQQGRFVYLNPAGARLQGAGSADQLIGTEMTALLHPDDREMIALRIRDMEAGVVNSAPLAEVQVLRSDGVPVTVEITSAVIPYNPGQAIHSMLRDITARKKVEKDLQKAVQDLRESNRDLEQFAYVASHDLNEPLRTVFSYIKLLEERYGSALGPDAAEMIGFIVDGGERMKEMIADLLDYSRITKGPAFTTVDCEDLLRTTLAQLEHQVTKERARVTHDQLPCVSGDAGQLQQVFLNLVTNAIKFHGPGHPQVHISAARGEEHLDLHVQRQWDRDPGRRSGTDLSDVPAAAYPGGIPRYRDRAGDLQKGGRTARGRTLGGEQRGAGINVPLHPPSAHLTPRRSGSRTPGPGPMQAVTALFAQLLKPYLP